MHMLFKDIELLIILAKSSLGLMSGKFLRAISLISFIFEQI
jgi:hypothetical protein